jgi:L-threonylcarbamoyladenylate synthase
MSSFEADLSDQDASFHHAAEILRRGGVVAFPTETSYGLAVNPADSAAIEKLFLLKGRQRNKAILLLVADLQQLETLVEFIPEQYNALIERYWPGPLTLIFPASPMVHPAILADDNTLGVRISPHPAATALLAAFGGPITATSANISGHKAARTGHQVRAMLGPGVDYIIEGEVPADGSCSTIVGHSDKGLKLIRSGQLELGEEGIL